MYWFMYFFQNSAHITVISSLATVNVQNFISWNWFFSIPGFHQETGI